MRKIVLCPNCGNHRSEEQYTQGGGTVVWCTLQLAYVFVTCPAWMTDCKPGDQMPEEWGTA